MTEKEGWDFSHIIEGGTQEDIDYILDAFIKAVEDRSLCCGGGVKSIKLDVLYCEMCDGELTEAEDSLCFECFDKLAKELGYEKK